MNKIINKIILPLLILAVPLPSFFWLQSNQVLGHGPLFPWQNADQLWETAQSHLYSWVSIGGYGSPITDYSSFFYYSYASLILRLCGNNHLGQSLFIYLSFVGCLASFYTLSRSIKLSRHASLAAGIFFLTNPIVFTGIPVEIVNLRILPFFISTPLLLRGVIKILNNDSRLLNYLILAVTSLFISSAGYSSLQYFALDLFLIALYIVIKLFSLRNVKLRLSTLIEGLKIVLFIVLINSYWLLPFFSNIFEAYSLRAEPGVIDKSLLSSLSVRVLDTLRLLPYPDQVQISTWLNYYSNPVVIIALFLLMSTAFSTLLLKRKSLVLIYFQVILLVSLLMAKGTQEPLGVIGEIALNSNKFVTRLFRNPLYFELPLIVAFSFMLGAGIDKCTNKSGKANKYKIILPTLLFGLIGLYGLPFYLGAPLNNTDPASPSQTIAIPSYYEQVVEVIRKDKTDFRVLSIPTFTAKDSYVAYRWNSLFVGTPSINVSTGKSLLRPVYYGSNTIDKTIESVLVPSNQSISSSDWINVVLRSNVKYITYHNDTAWDYINSLDLSYSNKETSEFLENNAFIDKIGTYGEVTLYQVPTNRFTPHIYVDSEGLDKGPKIKFSKVNPTKYRVKVENGNNSFKLLFLESYHTNWKVFLKNDNDNSSNDGCNRQALYFDGVVTECDHKNDFLNTLTFETLLKTPIAESSHKKILDYANAWDLKAEDIGFLQDYELIIEFTPQRNIYFGTLITFLTLLVSLSLYSFRGLPSKIKRKNVIQMK